MNSNFAKRTVKNSKQKQQFVVVTVRNAISFFVAGDCPILTHILSAIGFPDGLRSCSALAYHSLCGHQRSFAAVVRGRCCYLYLPAGK